MDFGTLRKKLFEVEYMSPLAFLDDLRLVFRNCEVYNMPTAPEFKAGQKLQRYMEKRVRELNLEPSGKARGSGSATSSPQKASPTCEPSTSSSGRRIKRK